MLELRRDHAGHREPDAVPWSNQSPMTRSSTGSSGGTLIFVRG
jgi:hypothetical protein